jgi:non-ribosomal peptide synthetase component F
VTPTESNHVMPAMDIPLHDPDRTAAIRRGTFADGRRGATGRAHPLSPAQHALWLAQQEDPTTSAYNLLFAARVRSAVDADRLECCLQKLVERHPALRTTFHDEGGRPVQRIHSVQEIRLTCVDARLWSDDQLAQIVRLTSRQAADLTDSVFRATLFSRAEEDHVLLLMAHEIAVDAWGLGLLLRELRDLYAGERLPPAPADTPLDYAADLAARIDGPEGKEMEEFWTARLAGARGALPLPYDRPASTVPHRVGSSIAFDLEPDRTARIRRIAREAETTPYVVLLTAFQVLLSLYSAEEDILVGSPFSGRMRRRWQNVVGNFVNTVVMRARVGATDSFVELLARGQESVSEAMRNREYPFARLCELVHEGRPRELAAACRIGFAWQGLPRMDALAGYLKLEGAPAPPSDFGGMALEPFPLPQQEGQTDLTLEMGGEVGNSLFGSLKYDSTRFEEATARRLVRHYRILLDRLLEEPGAPARSISLLDDAENEVVRAEWSASDREIRYPGGVHRLIEAQAARTPDATAVRRGDVRLTYEQLDRRANRLARVLRAEGVDPRSRVAVALDRSPDSLVALLAVLKAGAACVPIDPAEAAPAAADRLERAKVAAILGVAAGDDGSGGGAIRLRLDLPRLQDRMSRISAEPLGVAADPDAAAFVLLPRGRSDDDTPATVTHRATTNLLTSLGEELELQRTDRLLAVCPMPTADALLELLLPLGAGAEVVLAGEEEAVDPEWVARTLEEERITVMRGTARCWTELLESGWAGSDHLLALMDAGGLPAPMVDRLRRRVRRLWAVYGYPETGLCAAANRVDRLDRRGAALRPLPNSRLYVLDGSLRPVPLGMPGDLYVGGVPVTMELPGGGESPDPRLLADPFDPRGRGRLFRTGDRARRRGDGRVELLARSRPMSDAPR